MAIENPGERMTGHPQGSRRPGDIQSEWPEAVFPDTVSGMGGSVIIIFVSPVQWLIRFRMD